MKSVFILSGMLFAYITATPVFGSQGSDPVSVADWRVDAKPTVVERNFDNSDIARFMDNYRGVHPDDPENSESPAQPDQIGNFIWIDIDKNGVYELFVTFAESRAFFSGPTIYVSQGGNKTILQAMPGWPVLPDIKDALKDLDNDGTPELIMSSYSTYYRGAATTDIWTDIYRWNGQRFVNASASFKSYYQSKVLPGVERKIRELSAPGKGTLPVPNLDLQLALQQSLRDKILRFTATNARAGIDLARVWAKSENRELRALAIDVFKDAGINEYRADVQLLTTDPDSFVAFHAKEALKTKF